MITSDLKKNTVDMNKVFFKTTDATKLTVDALNEMLEDQPLIKPGTSLIIPTLDIAGNNKVASPTKVKTVNYSQSSIEFSAKSNTIDCLAKDQKRATETSSSAQNDKIAKH